MKNDPARQGEAVDRHRQADITGPNKTRLSTQPDAIATFCPAADEAERALRRRIHWVQGAAAARARRSQHWRARAILWLASEWAADITFAPASHADLQEVLNGLARLLLTAGAVERTEAVDD